MLFVLTHIDRLRPFMEWAPPYDLTAGGVSKANSIREALETVATEFQVTPSDVVPVNLAEGRIYNIDALWATMVEQLPDAQRARLLRRLDDARTDWNWRRIWSQATNAGRVIARSVR